MKLSKNQKHIIVRLLVNELYYLGKLEKPELEDMIYLENILEILEIFKHKGNKK